MIATARRESRVLEERNATIAYISRRRYSSIITVLVLVATAVPLLAQGQHHVPCSDTNMLVYIQVIKQFCTLGELSDLMQLTHEEINMCCEVTDFVGQSSDCVEVADSTALMSNWKVVCKLPSYRKANNTEQDTNSTTDVNEFEIQPNAQPAQYQDQTQDSQPSANFQAGVVAFRSAKEDIEETQERSPFAGTTILTPQAPNQWQQIVQALNQMQGLTFTSWFLSKLPIEIPLGQQVTIIAPLDSAYQVLCHNLNITLFDLEKLINWQDIMQVHVTLGEVPILEIVDRGVWLGTLQGSNLWVQRSILTGQVVMVGCCDPENIARVVDPDRRLQDGSIIHIVDNVILPQGSAFNKESVVFKNGK
eukprot:TRINITY_DN7214_c0_g3_i1.p2 TRINITY_DN7214_c0_g3~~TRINITY_DN7214_c0_g3_i1.p2  ORF type:complete len:363 (-),score=15.81 TRINITY_DN7214_c0_g3_i1:1155-2243(-)